MVLLVAFAIATLRAAYIFYQRHEDRVKAEQLAHA